MTVLTVTALPAAVNLKVYQGDDTYLDLTVNNPDGTPADLTGRTAVAQIRPSARAAQTAAAFGASIAGNVIHLHLAAADAAGLDGVYVWDCQAARTDGTDTMTVAAGQLR